MRRPERQLDLPDGDLVLRPKGATLLGQIIDRPMPVGVAHGKLQSTLGALYKRNLIAIQRVHGEKMFLPTPKGYEAHERLFTAKVDRSPNTLDSPFAAAIRELVDYAMRPVQKGKRAGVQVIHNRRRKNAA